MIMRKFLCGLLMTVATLAWSAEPAEDARLGAGDLVKISVYGYPDLTTETRVSETGNISFPLAGMIKVKGLSVHEAERVIGQLLAEGGFIELPQVTLLVEQFLSQEVSVLGFVNKPGRIPLDKPSRLLDVLASAGGLATASGSGTAGGSGTATTAAETATLIRKGGDKVEVDLRALFEGDMSLNHEVHGGDAIYVPGAPPFYVYGEVQHPGVYKLVRNMTVTQAISAAGGLTPKGTEWRPIVKRKNAQGGEDEISVIGSDQLRADDVLYIRESWF